MCLSVVGDIKLPQKCCVPVDWYQTVRIGKVDVLHKPSAMSLIHTLHILLIFCKLRCSCQEKEQERVNSFLKFRNEALFCIGTFDSLVVQNMYRESHIAH